jgi:hypothetical protein
MLAVLILKAMPNTSKVLLQCVCVCGLWTPIRQIESHPVKPTVTMVLPLVPKRGGGLPIPMIVSPPPPISGKNIRTLQETE